MTRSCPKCRRPRTLHMEARPEYADVEDSPQDRLRQRAPPARVGLLEDMLSEAVRAAAGDAGAGGLALEAHADGATGRLAVGANRV